jgi:hypothetical protein
MICVKKLDIYVTYYSNCVLRSAAHSSDLSFKVQAQRRPVFTEAQLKDQQLFAALIKARAEAQDFGRCSSLFMIVTENRFLASLILCLIL